MCEQIGGVLDHLTRETDDVRIFLSTTNVVAPVRVAVIQGRHIFEGDIRIRQEVTPKGAVSSAESRRWPHGKIAYDIASELRAPERVRNAMNHWEAVTPITFVRRTTEPNYVVFENGDSCESEVGMQGGRQAITLGPNCSIGNAIHEIGHTVGLWHEHSREDRNLWIKIDWSNVADWARRNFDQEITDGDDVGEYDYGSIMHYSPFAFAIDPSQPTIKAKQTVPTGVVIGQRTALSAGDRAAVARLYGHDSAPVG